MKAKDIEQKLNNGSKLIIVYRGYFDDLHYIDSEKPENRINKKQFSKYKEKCLNKDESQNNDMGVKGKQYRHYYWL